MQKHAWRKTIQFNEIYHQNSAKFCTLLKINHLKNPYTLAEKIKLKLHFFNKFRTFQTRAKIIKESYVARFLVRKPIWLFSFFKSLHWKWFVTTLLGETKWLELLNLRQLLKKFRNFFDAKTKVEKIRKKNNSNWHCSDRPEKATDHEKKDNLLGIYARTQFWLQPEAEFQSKTAARILLKYGFRCFRPLKTK